MILPIEINLQNWAASLSIDFPNDDIPILTQEENWKEWGNQLIQAESFFNNNAPSTDIYNDWQSWANHVFFVMNNSNADQNEGSNV
jgi:hypothetical protein